MIFGAFFVSATDFMADNNAYVYYVQFFHSVLGIFTIENAPDSTRHIDNK